MKKGVGLYLSRIDKEWGLTDCISFVVMKEEGLSLAMTAINIPSPGNVARK